MYKARIIQIFPLMPCNALTSFSYTGSTLILYWFKIDSTEWFLNVNFFLIVHQSKTQMKKIEFKNHPLEPCNVDLLIILLLYFISTLILLKLFNFNLLTEKRQYWVGFFNLKSELKINIYFFLIPTKINKVISRNNIATAHTLSFKTKEKDTTHCIKRWELFSFFFDHCLWTTNLYVFSKR